MSGFSAAQTDHTGATPYRLDRGELVRRGRRRTYRRTAIVAVALLLLQYPLRQVAIGDWESRADLPREVPARLSLLVDLAMIFAYVVVARRALELALSRPASSTGRRRGAWVAFALVVAGAVLDVVEDVSLWIDAGRAAPEQADLTLPWSIVMQLLVAVGLVAGLLIAFVGGRGVMDTPADPPAQPRPGMVICCSGGGIRAASFCLGGLQALGPLYHSAHSVVGVSGGGYMAAAHHVVRWKSERPPTDPPAFTAGSPEEAWLRRHTRYLFDSAEVGVFAVLSVLFGIAVNLIFITAILGATAWLTGWFLLASGGLVGWSGANATANDYQGSWVWVDRVWLPLAAGLVLFVLAKLVDRLWPFDFAHRQHVRAITMYLVAIGAALVAVLLALPVLLAWLHDYAYSHDNAYADLLKLLGFAPTIDDQSAGAGESSGAAVSAASIAAIAATLLAVVRAIGSSLGDGEKESPTKWLGKLWAKVKTVVLPWVAAIVIVLLLVGVFLTWTAGLLNRPEDLSRWYLAFLYGGLVAACFVLTDANRTSLHHFYRERLSSAYLLRRTGSGAPEPVPYTEALRFSEAAPVDGGPRLVSCAVANVKDLDLVPTDRDCTSFVFGHDRIGLSDALLPPGSLLPSASYEFAADHRFRDATIPAAMAISGAAFSPLAGRENAKLAPYRLVLAMANARLGVWLPNPLWVDEESVNRRIRRTSTGRARQAWRGLEWIRAQVTKPNPFLVFREAFGRTSVLDRHLYVTDGGHYDNLGLVEALRGRPHEVIVLDASNDPEDTFRALGRAIATARMDLGCDIELDPRAMRRLSADRATSAWAHGTITYRSESSGERLQGDLWIVKSIMLDSLSWDVETYRADNAQFPRTSTGNQLYGEFDLEAYRALGHALTTRMVQAREQRLAERARPPRRWCRRGQT